MIKLLFLLMLMISPAYSQSQGRIILNPNRSTPLSAVLRLDDTNSEKIYISIEGKTADMSVIHTFNVGYGKDIPILGLYENYSNKIIIKIGKDRQTTNIIVTPKIEIPRAVKTGAARTDAEVAGSVDLRAKILVDRLPKGDPFNQDFYFVTLTVNGGVVAFDRKGDLRYVYRVNNSIFTIARMELDPNNKQRVVMVGVDNFKRYQRVDLIGNKIQDEPIDSHHEAVPYINGMELILGNSQWGWEDAIFVLDRNKRIQKRLYLGDIFKKAVNTQDKILLKKIVYDSSNRATNSRGQYVRSDWAHINGIIYDALTDTLYLSARNVGVIAVNMASWTLKWFMTHENLKIDEGFAYGERAPGSLNLTDIPSLQRYRFRARGEEPKGQHALILHQSGNLIMFDNNADDNANKEGSRVVEYAINEKFRMARKVREFSRHEQFSRLMSDVDLVGKFHFNWLILYGYGPRKTILEVNPANQVIFEMVFDTKAPFYRIDQFPMYPYADKDKLYTIDSL